MQIYLFLVTQALVSIQNILFYYPKIYLLSKDTLGLILNTFWDIINILHM